MWRPIIKTHGRAALNHLRAIGVLRSLRLRCPYHLGNRACMDVALIISILLVTAPGNLGSGFWRGVWQIRHAKKQQRVHI